jgi:hypothetical protein
MNCRIIASLVVFTVITSAIIALTELALARHPLNDVFFGSCRTRGCATRFGCKTKTERCVPVCFGHASAP